VTLRRTLVSTCRQAVTVRGNYRMIRQVQRIVERAPDWTLEAFTDSAQGNGGNVVVQQHAWPAAKHDQ